MYPICIDLSASVCDVYVFKIKSRNVIYLLVLSVPITVYVCLLSKHLSGDTEIPLPLL